MAMAAMAKGKPEDSIRHYRKAFELEMEAAARATPTEGDPLIRFIYLRSAAALAYHAGLFDEANKFVALTMSENPPPFIVDELNEISDLVIKARPAARKIGSLQIEGKFAAATENEITVLDAQSSRPFTILGPAGKLNDIVKNFFLEMVTIQATTNSQGAILLKNISKAA